MMHNKYRDTLVKTAALSIHAAVFIYCTCRTSRHVYLAFTITILWNFML